ncbi:hypothetical protein [Lutimonas sp.]|uniref:hypothetical protein n=1 Tax=Lutimonas sp. TaxID=1872403 RepID=UPI003D9AB76F
MFFLSALTSVAQQRQKLNWKPIESLEFDFSKEEYSSDSIFFYHALLKRSASDEQPSEGSSFSFQKHAKPLDLYHYWDRKGDEQYDVLLTKVAYVLDKSIDFFTEDRLSDPRYIALTMPSAKINRVDSIYHISVGFGAPEIDYALHFYSDQELEEQYPELQHYFKQYDGMTESPGLIVVQHNYHYGKVMFQETSKMSISISRYYALNDGQTLAFNYTLNYIHNMPPSFIGGSDFLIDKIKKGIKGLIDETQYICRTTEMTE